MEFPIELGLILLFSVLGGVLAVRFRQPSVLGLIIVGAIVGPYNLGIIKDTSLINASIEIGAILLLFTVGIEFSLQKMLNLGLRAIVVAVIKLGIVFLISYYAAVLLGFGFLAALYIGVILSITSTVIFIKILDQKGLYKREEIPLLIAVLIIEDIFGVFALTFFSNLNASTDLAPLNLATKLILALTVMAVAYVVLQRVLKPTISWLVKYSTEDTITFTSLGLCGGMSYLALLLNLSPSVGAFLAGNIVASLPNSKSFEKAIHPFILTFTSLFFFSIGTTVNFSAVFSGLWIILALFAVNVLAKFMTIGFGSYIFTNFTGRQAVFSGIAMLSVGEFSLLIAKEAKSIGIGIDLVSLTASIIVLSSIAMAILLKYDEKIYNLMIQLLPFRVKEDMGLTSKYFNTVSWSMIKDKVNSKRMSLEWKAIVNNLAILFFILAVSFFAWRSFSTQILAILKNESILYAVVVLLFVSIMFPTLKVISNVRVLLKDSLTFFVKLSPTEVIEEKKIFRDIFIASVLFISLILFPIIFSYRPYLLYNLIALALLIIIVVALVLRVSSLIRTFTKKHETTLNKFSKKYKLLLQQRMRTYRLEGKNE